MIIFALIMSGVAVVLFAAFVAVVVSIHSTDRRMNLRDPQRSGARGTLVRRLLGVYARQPGRPQRGVSCGDQAAHCGPAGR